MANRQALRELQNRLAVRLQAAQQEGVSVVWLAAESGGLRYLFPLNQAGEIFPWSLLHKVPHTQSWFLGVANLRGGLFGVVDFASIVRNSADDVQVAIVSRNELSLAETSLLAFNPALGVQSVLVIDKLLGLRGGEAFISFEDSDASQVGWFGPVYLDEAGVRWQEIDLQLLAQDSSFLNISR